MQYINDICYCEYHSRIWDNLVEMGYVTDSVQEQGSIKYARMIKQTRSY